MARAALALGLEGMAEMHDPAHFWIYTLHIGFGNLIYAHSNLESRCRKRHKFRISIGLLPKEIGMLGVVPVPSIVDELRLGFHGSRKKVPQALTWDKLRLDVLRSAQLSLARNKLH